MADRDREQDDGARLVEAVLRDPELRARLRRDPSTQAALETLEIRESKSSLAGALAAAAVEGLALYELVEHGGLGAGVAEAAEAPPSPSLLNNRNVEFDAAGLADLRAGRIDPRIVAVLEEIGRHHRITVSAMLSDHGVRTAGGSISNHHYGRAVDIAMVDGQRVTPGNAAARELARSLLRLEPRLRPTELGSPWALGDPVTFTDGDHQDHIHVAYDDPPPRGWTPPASAAAPVIDADGADSGEDAEGDDSSDSDSDGDSDDESDSDEVDYSSPALDDVDEPDDPSEEYDEDDDEEDDEDEDEDEDEDDSDGEDEDEPDEDEPDEDEPDEVGPDFDDLTDDEYQPAAAQVPVAPPPDVEVDSAPVAVDGAPTEYPGDTAPPERVAAWMAAEAQRRGLPAELPVMAALVESGLRNLPGGDADSIGFFQMRASFWDSGEYAGYAAQPRLQLEWFLDHAEQVRDQRLARGLSIRDPGHYGDWIADVERPAEQYRGRYQLRLEDARELLRGFQPTPAAPDANQAQVLPVIRADQVVRRPR